jgi:oxalate decarboxylase/phosphoglucose isomerase-like protein (cupin superfamily)
MPAASLMAGVDMRLEAGGYRELHWHVASEWSIVLNGSCRIQVSYRLGYMILFYLPINPRIGRQRRRTNIY